MSKEERDEWERLRYSGAFSDLRWAKEQGWRVTQWTVALVGAIYWLSKVVDGPFELFVALLAGTVVVSVSFLISLQGFAISRRADLRKYDAHDRYKSKVLDLPDKENNHPVLFGVRIAVVVATAVLVAWAVCSAR